MTRTNNEALADRQVDEGQWIHAGAGSNDNVTNLAALSTRDRALWMDGYQWGRVGGLADGHREGYAACHGEIARPSESTYRTLICHRPSLRRTGVEPSRLPRRRDVLMTSSSR